MAMKIGWIGCGVMGRSMLQHCIDGGFKNAFVYNRTPSKCTPLLALGATLCHSPAEVAEKADAIFSIVGYPKDVEDVVFGDRGVIEGLKTTKESPPKKYYIDMTTSTPTLARRIAAALSEYNCSSLDAPVSGGDIGAREGRLAIMVGGEEQAFNDVLKIFRCMGAVEKGGKVEWVGGAGAGQHTKMTNQILIATNMIGVVEALLYAGKAGLNIEKTLQIVSSGAAGSWSLSNLAPRMVRRDFEPGFVVGHFVKDMEIALDEARRMNLCLPGLALSHQLYVALKAQGEELKGTQALLLAIERVNGIHNK